LAWANIISSTSVGLRPILAEVLDQVIDLVVGQREAQFGVRRHQRGLAAAEDVDRGQRLRRDVVEEFARGVDGIEHGFGHAVMQQGGNSPCRQRRLLAFAREVVSGAALDALHRRKTAVPGDVRGLGAPGRDRAQARRHQQQAAGGRGGQRRGNAQQIAQPRLLIGRQRAFQLDEIPMFGGQLHPGELLADRLLQARQTRRGKRGGTAQGKEFSHDQSTGKKTGKAARAKAELYRRRPPRPAAAAICQAAPSLRHCAPRTHFALSGTRP
jgi:hypothetical protein